VKQEQGGGGEALEVKSERWDASWSTKSIERLLVEKIAGRSLPPFLERVKNKGRLRKKISILTLIEINERNSLSNLEKSQESIKVS
jgi:hypothetical protein